MNGVLHGSEGSDPLYFDDLDGGEAEGTVRFALDGADYEIDPSSAHNEALHKTLEAYIAHARKVGASSLGSRGADRKSTGTVDTTKILEWAKAQGLEIKERGRVPSSVVEQYREATGSWPLAGRAVREALSGVNWTKRYPVPFVG